MELSKLNIFRIVQIKKLTNLYNCFNLENQNSAKKIGHFGIFRPRDILQYSQFFQFSYLPFDIPRQPLLSYTSSPNFLIIKKEKENFHPSHSTYNFSQVEGKVDVYAL